MMRPLIVPASHRVEGPEDVVEKVDGAVLEELPFDAESACARCYAEGVPCRCPLPGFEVIQ